MKKKNSIWDQEEHKGGEISGLLWNSFFVFAKQFFCLNLNFFHFGISNFLVIANKKFKKNFNYEGIELIVQIIWTHNWKIWLIYILFFYVFLEYWTHDLLPGHEVDTWLKKFCPKYGRPFDSVPGIFWHVPVPRTCPGHF